MIEMMDEPDELLDLVDETDTPIGTLARKEILQLEAEQRGFTRAVGVFLVNSQRKLWIPKRGEHKKIAPGGLDFSAGEHVLHGESYESAALRGLHEELDLTADIEKIEQIGVVPPFPGMPYFHRIFLYHTDVSPTYNRDDYTGYDWLSPEEALSRLRSGVPAKEVLLPSIGLILSSTKTVGGNK